MYEEYTRQALPSKKYRELIGTALIVFNANNSFLIENFLNSVEQDADINWHELIDKTSGILEKIIRKNIPQSDNLNRVLEEFKELVEKRNRIIHSFQVTNDDGDQVLATKEKDGKQFEITEEYLISFIKKNDKLCLELYDIRDQYQSSNWE